MNKKFIIDNKLGPIFPQPVRIMGLIFCGFGVLTLFQFWYVGILMMVIGGYVGFGTNGICMDVSAQKYKTYTKWFGFRNGEWKSLDPFPFVCVLNKQVGLRLSSQGNRKLDLPESTYVVCLLSSTHRTKVILRQEDTPGAAEKYADFIAKELKKEVVQYAPEISTQTRERNMRRR